LLLSAFIPFIYSRTRKGEKLTGLKAVAYCIIFVIVALFIFSPWMIRNYIWTENPIYPLYRGYINQGYTNPEAISDIPRMNHFTIRKIIYQEEWWETLLIPMRIFFQGQDDNPRLFDGKLNPFLLILPFFSFFNLSNMSQKLKTEKNFFAIFSILFLFIVFLRYVMRTRYTAVIVPPLVILSVFGLYEIAHLLNSKTKKQFIRASPLAIIIATIFMVNGIYIFGRFNFIQPISYLSGKVTKDEYIEKFRPEYPSIKYINENIPEQSVVNALFIGRRGYYSNRSLNYKKRWLISCIKNTHSVEEVLLNFQKNDIKYLLIRYDFFNNWFNDNFTDLEKKVFKEFLSRYGEELFYKNGHGVIKIVEQA
jgi:hypothetical protein